MSNPLWIGTWENMNDLQRAGLKEKLGPEILREAEAIVNRLPEKERTQFACMYCLDTAAKVVMDRVREAVRIELPQ